VSKRDVHSAQLYKLRMLRRELGMSKCLFKNMSEQTLDSVFGKVVLYY